MRHKTIWITWEDQRRTNELSKALGVELYKVLFRGNYLLKVIRNTVVTVGFIIKKMPEKVIVQNNSMALTALLCLMKDVFGFKVIVDRHSNFKLHTMNSTALVCKAYHSISRYTARKADLTIVTNCYLKDIIREWGGKGFVLQDKIPAMDLKEHCSLLGKYNVVFPCSYDPDEPVSAVIDAVRRLPKEITIYCTGNYKKLDPSVLKNAPSNIIFTGFLNEKEYQSLLYSSDMILALTEQDYTLLCCAYEGVALLKPLVISKKRGLKEYFYKGVILTENCGEEIANSIIAAINNYDNLKSEMRKLSNELIGDWQVRFNNLQVLMTNL